VSPVSSVGEVTARKGQRAVGTGVAHAGMKASLQGRASQQVREFALYGETTGETDVYGLPMRHNWAAEYRGQARVVYGHTPTPEAEWLHRTINIDTGCVFGGKLTALRYPEPAFVSVPAARIYTEPIRPFLPATADPRTAQQQTDEWLDLDEVLGKQAIHTRLWPPIVMMIWQKDINWPKRVWPYHAKR
jgi:protein phosphatase